MLDIDFVRLISFQAPDFWDALRKNGSLMADPTRVYPGFRAAYRWMRRRMRERLPGYRGGWPLWAWLLRECDPEPEVPQESCVRLELRVSPERVLLSDFDGWHAVLNRVYLSLSEEEDEAWEARLPCAPRWRELPPRFKKAVVRSWERIFDLDLMARSWWTEGRQRIQAVLEVIKLEDVVRVAVFG